MNRLEEWMQALVDDFGLDPALATTEARDLLLDLSRDVAHGVARPAAPVTTFLLGVAAGQRAAEAGSAPSSVWDVTRELAARVQARVPAPEPEDDRA